MQLLICTVAFTLRIYYQKNLYFNGWIGFSSYTVDMFGYALDGVEKLDSAPYDDITDAIISSGGQYSKKFRVFVDTSKLDVGEHTCKFLVRINTSDSTATLLIHEFTIVVTE